MITLGSATATYVTMSGRVYRLVGVPRLCSDGEYALNRWLHINELPELRDVTAEVFIDIQDAARRARSERTGQEPP